MTTSNSHGSMYTSFTPAWYLYQLGLKFKPRNRTLCRRSIVRCNNMPAYNKGWEDWANKRVDLDNENKYYIKGTKDCSLGISKFSQGVKI